MTISCGSDESYYASADVVFEGLVTEREHIDDQPEGSLCWSIEHGKKCGSKVATFNIQRSEKGNLNVGDQVTVYAGDGCYCADPYLDKGLRYIVYAKTDGVKADYYSLDTCATRQLNEKENITTQ